MAPLVDFCENDGVYSGTLGLDQYKGVGFQSFALHRLKKGFSIFNFSLQSSRFVQEVGFIIG